MSMLAVASSECTGLVPALCAQQKLSRCNIDCEAQHHVCNLFVDAASEFSNCTVIYQVDITFAQRADQLQEGGQDYSIRR